MAGQGETITSPDGLYRVDFDACEMRMSHTVFSPVVTHIPTGRVLFNLAGTLWDAEASFDGQGRLAMFMRRYPGDRPGHHAVFDLGTGQVLMRESVAGAEPYTITMEEFRRIHSREYGGALLSGLPAAAPPPAKRRDPGQVLAMVVFGAVLLGAGTWAFRAWTPVGTLEPGADWIVALFGSVFGVMPIAWVVAFVIHPALKRR